MPIPNAVAKDMPVPAPGEDRTCRRCFFFRFGDGTGSGPKCGLTGKPFEKWREAVLDKKCDMPKAGLRTCENWTSRKDMEDI